MKKITLFLYFVFSSCFGMNKQNYSYSPTEVIDALLSEDGVSYFKHAINDKNFDPNQELVKANGSTALFLAMSWNKKEIFNVLLKCKQTDVNQELKEGISYPLFYACYAYLESKNYFVEELLKRKDLNVNKSTIKCPPCLFYAINTRNANLVSLLLAHHAIDLTIKSDGYTPYLCACRMGLTDIAKMIKEREMNKTNEKVCF